MIRLIVYALAVWRLTYMLVKEDGPEAIFAIFRAKAGVRYDPNGQAYGENFLSEVLSCFWCCSVWAAAILLVAPRWVNTVLAGSALAIGLRKVIE